MKQVSLFITLIGIFTFTHHSPAEDQATSSTATIKDLPSLQDNPLEQSKTFPTSAERTDVAPAQNQSITLRQSNTAKQAAFNKDVNWAVEGLKEKRELEKLELEKKETSSLDEILEKERKSIQDAPAKPTTSLNHFKPSIDNSWQTNNAVEKNTSKQSDALSTNSSNIQGLGDLQNAWSSNLTNTSSQPQFKPDSAQAFDERTAAEQNQTNQTPGFKPLYDLQGQLNETKVNTNYDNLVKTGQAQNFKKLSNDPSYQVSGGETGQRLSINSVPGMAEVPKPVTSTMSVTTMRQIENDRINAIPKPSFKELNSRIPDPAGTRF